MILDKDSRNIGERQSVIGSGVTQRVGQADGSTSRSILQHDGSGCGSDFDDNGSATGGEDDSGDVRVTLDGHKSARFERVRPVVDSVVHASSVLAEVDAARAPSRSTGDDSQKDQGGLICFERKRH